MGKTITDLRAITTVGLDLAKHVFQVHAIDAKGRVITAKAVRRKDLLAFFAALPVCVVGFEACGSAHHWARELSKLGHDARLMPPAYVKPYVRRQKSDAADAAAICEAVTRPSMRFVPVRLVENQAALTHHKLRDLLVGHLSEIGIIAAQGPNNARALATLISESNETVPAAVRATLAPLVRQLVHLDEGIGQSDRAIPALAKADETARRLMTIPGIGPVTASALAASVRDISISLDHGSSPPFSASPRGKSPLAGRSVRDTFPKWAIDICANCWWSGLTPFSIIAKVAAMY